MNSLLMDRGAREIEFDAASLPLTQNCQTDVGLFGYEDELDNLLHEYKGLSQVDLSISPNISSIFSSPSRLTPVFTGSKDSAAAAAPPPAKGPKKTRKRNYSQYKRLQSYTQDECECHMNAPIKAKAVQTSAHLLLNQLEEDIHIARMNLGDHPFFFQNSFLPGHLLPSIFTSCDSIFDKHRVNHNDLSLNNPAISQCAILTNESEFWDHDTSQNHSNDDKLAYFSSDIKADFVCDNSICNSTCAECVTPLANYIFDTFSSPKNDYEMNMLLDRN